MIYRYVVNTGKRNRYFEEFSNAVDFCNRVFSKTKIVLSIERKTIRPAIAKAIKDQRLSKEGK